MSFVQRTHTCGELRAEHVGQTLTLNGWAHKVRDLGGLVFIDVRDRSGLVQLVVDPTYPIPDVKPESCLSVTGTIRLRDEANRNPKLATGEIEVAVSALSVLSPAKPLPFPISDEEEMGRVNEELRVKYRYLDLRRPSMQRKLMIRAAAVSRIRRYLDAKGFFEIETPIFTKSTPEGARDYLIPYRLDPGRFYALPQSPQQYKQLLMVSGLERYYQIAKCFRDEAQRADRQPEFTQLDLEMSFVTQEDILRLTEDLIIAVLNDLIEEYELPKEPVKPFPRLTYDESMRRYGNDKPDLRFDLELFDISGIVAGAGFGVFKSTVESGGVVRGVRYPGGASLSRKEVGEVEASAKEFGAKGMASIAVEPAGHHAEGAVQVGEFWVRSSIVKFFSTDELAAILRAARAEPGDLLCFIADEWRATCDVLSRLRNLIGQRCKLADPRKLQCAWVLDFPLVEWNPDDSRWEPSHHPFTSPKVEDLIYIDTDPGRMRADCYDLVCNGVEWASGSIRIHDPVVQERIFKLIGIAAEDAEARFGHMLEAFKYGAPPHGGIAPGIDRMVMFLTDDENIREVIAFPKIGQGVDPLMDSPSTVDPQQWAELGLRLAK